jgi:hypothetical protein
MGIGAFINGFHTIGYHTETAGTTIDEKVPGHNGQKLALTMLSYLSAATAHSISFMYPKDSSVANAGTSRNTTSASAASGQAVVNVTNTPKDPAGNAAAGSDIVAYQLTDGTWEFNTISSVSTKAITLSSNITGIDSGAGATAIASGAKFLIFGVVGDNACFKLKGTASAQKDWQANGCPVLVHPNYDEPFYVTVDNGTNAGFLQNATFAYIN